jgi:hypothetical protein
MSAPTQRERDLELAKIAKKHGGNYCLRTVLEARRADVPVSALFGLINVETGDWQTATGGQNIFGCDLGGPKSRGVPFCNSAVTRAKVQQLIQHVRGGGASNGVGPTQLTSLDYIMRAERLGGAHLTANTIRVGAEVLHEKTGGDMGQAWKFNGSFEYQHKFEHAAGLWHARLTNG